MAQTPAPTDAAPTAVLTSPAARIHAAEVKHLYQLSRAAYPGTLINAAIVCVALWGVVNQAAIIAWGIAIVVVTGCRYALYREYSSRRVRPVEGRRWGHYFAVGAACSGAMWGVLGSALYPAQSLPYQFLVIFVIGGMLTAAMVVLSPVPRAYFAFVLAAWLPVTVTVLLQGTPLHQQMAVLMALFLVVLLSTGPAVARAMRESLRAQFENNELLRELYEAHGAAREANRRLNEQNLVQRRTAEELRATTHKLQALVESSPLAILVLDREGRIQKWNREAERMFGWREAELIGQPVPYLPAELADEERGFRNAILAGRMPALTETARLRRDGTRITVDYSSAALFDSAGEVTGYVAMIGDATERKRAEQQQSLQTSVTVLLAESQTVEEALPQVIRTLCETLGWVYGARWIVDRASSSLISMEHWCVEDPAVQAFATMSSRRRDVPGQYAGLLRRTWSTGATVWLADVEKEATLARRDAALAAGLRSALALPIVVDDEFYGVLEFFGREPRPLDAHVMALAQNVSSQIGQFIARRQAENDLKFVASHDALTGLLNRTMFMQRVQQAIAQAQRHERTLAVLFVDLDGFKSVNDTLGHDAGDALLVELAQRLRSSLREGDTVGRMGGDEFVVLIEEYAEDAQLVEVAKKLLETVAQPFHLREQSRQVTASIGIAMFGADGRDAQALLRHADLAMYRAKQSGKNQFRFFAADLDSAVAGCVGMEESLRRGIERGELLLYLQPKLAVADERVIGVEALVRWRHPSQGIINPAEFLRLAEDAGLMSAIGDWQLQAVAAQLRAWRGTGMPPIRIAINLLAPQLLQDGLLHRLREMMQEAELDASRIELEINEALLLQHEARGERLLPQLKQAGMRLIADDFGTGQASLGLLRRFSFDGVKVDRALVEPLPGSPSSAAATRAVIGMARSLGLEATADGVDTREQYEFLRDLLCDAVQGDYFCAAGPADEISRILVQSGGLLKRASVQPLRSSRPGAGGANGSV